MGPDGPAVRTDSARAYAITSRATLHTRFIRFSNLCTHRTVTLPFAFGFSVVSFGARSKCTIRLESGILFAFKAFPVEPHRFILLPWAVTSNTA